MPRCARDTGSFNHRRSSASIHAHILRAAQPQAPGGAAREIEPRAFGVGDAEGAAVVDAHAERAAVLRVAHGERGAERPGARRRRVAVGVEGLARGGVPAGPVIARQHFLPGAAAGPVHVFVHRAPAPRVRGGGERDEAQREAEGDQPCDQLHANLSRIVDIRGPVGRRSMGRERGAGRGGRVRAGQLCGANQGERGEIGGGGGGINAKRRGWR